MKLRAAPLLLISILAPSALAQSGALMARVRLQDQVLQALLQDPRLSPFPLAASVQRDGRVLLQGTVPVPSDRKWAQQLVQHIHGVTGVTNHIQVSPAVTALPPAAAPLPRKPWGGLVADALHSHPALVNVEVQQSGNQIILRGSVANSSLRQDALRLARSETGAGTGVRLVDEIQIRPGAG